MSDEIAPDMASTPAVVPGVARAEAGAQRPAGAAEETRDAFLGDRLMLRQPARGYRAGVDAVLLAAAVDCHAGKALRVLDAGAGVGTAGLCLARRCPAVHVTLLELQAPLTRLARANVADNGLCERVRVVEADLLDAKALTAAEVARESFDIAIANPPFHDAAAGTASADAVKAAAHAMPRDGLDDWLRALAHLTRPGGRVVVIHKAESLAELLAACRGRFGGLTVRPIQPRAETAAIRVIVSGIKGSRAPLQLSAPFVLHGEGHAFTPAADAVLRLGAALDGPPSP